MGTRGPADDKTAVEATLRAILRDVLGLSEARAAALDDTSPLFGAIPELDSMAVASLFGEIEERFGIRIDDDEVDLELLARFGTLATFVAGKTLR